MPIRKGRKHRKRRKSGSDQKTTMSTRPKRTRQERFERWFGDSKIRHQDGSPMVVYHGTTDSFDRFDREKSKGNGLFGSAFYFTSRRSDAMNYIDGGAWSEVNKRRGDSKILDVYLRIENPFHVKEGFGRDEWEDFKEKMLENSEDYIVSEKELSKFLDRKDLLLDTKGKVDFDTFFTSYLLNVYVNREVEGFEDLDPDDFSDRRIDDYYNAIEEEDKRNGQLVADSLRDMGYDGIVLEDLNHYFTEDYGDLDDTTHFVAFEPMQVKLTTSEGFSTEDDRMNKSNREGN